MKLSYKQKLFSYFFIVFAAFSVVLTVFQQGREKAYKTENLRSSLNEYADIINRYMATDRSLLSTHSDTIGQILRILPPSLRLTVVSHDGTVLFDNNLSKR